MLIKNQSNSLEHNVLYSKRGNSCLTKKGLRLTTLIMGAKCIDDVVLVGDRKVTGGFGDTYIDKIRRCSNANWAVFGAAGIETLYSEFLTILPQKIEEHSRRIQYQNQRLLNQHTQEFMNNPDATKPPLNAYYTEDFKQDCVELLTEIRNRYAVAFVDPLCSLDVLMGLAVENEPSRLYYLNSTHCLPVEVNQVLAIGQSDLAEVFRKCWNREMTMEQTAKLGMLAIKYIEQEGISDGIGVGKYQPQVWYVPNATNALPKELLSDELSVMVNDVDSKVAVLHTQMHSLFMS